MLRSNEEYFEIAKNNPEPIFEDLYAHTERDADIAVKNCCVRDVMRRLWKMQRQRRKNKSIGTGAYEALRILCKNDAAKHTPFGAFVTACGTTLKEICGDSSVFKEVTDSYLRHRTVESYSHARMWIQAQTDKGVSRSGVADKIFTKLAFISAPHGFAVTHSAAEFLSKEKAMIRFKYKELKNTGLGKDISIDFLSDNEQVILLKNGDQFILILAKHLNDGGGAQDNQFKNLEGFISSSSSQENVRCAFLDGNLSNVKLAEASSETEIAPILEYNPNSFWLNTEGFTQFIADFA